MDGSRAQRLVVFDFDGTLADTWRDLETALNRTLADGGKPPVTGPDVRAWIGDGALKLMERALPESESTPERLAVWYERFRVHYDQCCLETTELYPGIARCLDDLSSERLAVLSNKPGRFLERIIDGLHLKGHFDAVLGGDAIEARKPDPRVLHNVIQAVDPHVQEVWMVGDSGVDIETGRSAGARTIGCAWGLRGRDELRAAGAEFMIEAADEIAPIVLGRHESVGAST